MILKIVIPILTILFCYYTGIFIYYYRKTKSFKTSLKNTAILLLPIILLFCAVEFAFRVIISNKIMHNDNRFFTRNFATAYYFIYNQQPHTTRYIRLREPYPNNPKVLNPGMSYQVKIKNLKDTTYLYVTDKDGFVLPEFRGGDKSIFFLGGSTTECMYVQEKNRFSYLVGSQLYKYGLKYTTKNGGFSGNNTFHSINNLINKVLPYKPEAVVLMHAINDLSILLWEKSYHNSNPTKSLVVDRQSAQIYENAFGGTDEFGAKRGKMQTIDTNVAFKEFRNALTLFTAICRAQEIHPVLMTQFNRIEYGNINSCRQLKELTDSCKRNFINVDYIVMYKRMNDIIREVAIKENVLLIDLDGLVPKSEKYVYDAVHLNDSGSIYVANIISEHLIKYLKQSATESAIRL